LAFIVEVYASEAGIGAVLSQRSGTSLKLRPCAFFLRKLSPAERNYDVGDGDIVLRRLSTLSSSGLTTLIWSTSGREETEPSPGKVGHVFHSIEIYDII
jgi:hypothetical protein